jgi:spore maturation protein SpmB
MALNYVFVFFFLTAFVIGLAKLIFMGDTQVFFQMVTASFDMAKSGFEISLGLTGVLTMWMGVMKIGEMGGVVNLFAKVIGPFFNRLFPSLGKDHPAYGPIMMKPLSGSGSRGLMVDAMRTYGADSFVGKLSCIVQGTTDTTFYILAVYFGSVGIKNTRYAVWCGLIADLFGFSAAILVGYLFFH